MSFKALLLPLVFCSATVFSSMPNAGLSIIYTNDMEGSIATCGCATDPGGGVERRINWYKQSNFSPFDTVYINSGSTLFPDTAFLDYETEYLKVGASIMADSLSAMNIDAYTPGASDLKMGKGFFKTTTKKLPVLITNSNSKEFLKEVKIKKAGLNIKILGITTQIKELSNYDPVKALRKFTAKKGKKDFFILLADTDTKTLNTILKNINNLDVVLSSSIEEQLTKPVKIGNSTIVRVLRGGDSIGVFEKENKVVFLGRVYAKDNEFSDRIKKYEGLQSTAAPKIKDDF